MGMSTREQEAPLTSVMPWWERLVGMNADAAAEYADAFENWRGRCRLDPPKVAGAPPAAADVFGAESHVLCFLMRFLVAERDVLPLPLRDDRTLTVAPPSLVSTLKLAARILSAMGLRAGIFARPEEDCRSPGLNRLPPPLSSPPPEVEDLIELRETGLSR